MKFILIAVIALLGLAAGLLMMVTAVAAETPLLANAGLIVVVICGLIPALWSMLSKRAPRLSWITLVAYAKPAILIALGAAWFSWQLGMIFAACGLAPIAIIVWRKQRIRSAQ